MNSCPVCKVGRSSRKIGLFRAFSRESDGKEMFKDSSLACECECVRALGRVEWRELACFSVFIC